MMLVSLLVLVAATTAGASLAAPLQNSWLDASCDVETRLAALLPTLSIDQLATQTLHLWTDVSMSSMLEHYGTTGVGAMYIARPTGNSTCDADAACNLAARLAANRALMDTASGGPGIPVTFVLETLHSPWVAGGAIFPMPVALGATWNTSLVEAVGGAIAAEAVACGATRAFSPEINVCTDPRFGRTMENFGSDAQHVASMGVAMATGLQGGHGDGDTPSTYVRNGSLSCEAKHLAAYGAGNMDGAPADISPMTLHDIYLRPWRKFFAAGGRGAMLSHNSINGIPAHMHKEIMTDIIRGDGTETSGGVIGWNHSKVFFASDFKDIDLITRFKMAGSLEEAALLSVEAGMDQALGGSAFQTLNASVKAGKLDRAVLERAAAATLREKIAGGLFDRTFDGASDGAFGNARMCRPAATNPGGVLDCAEHRALALRAAQEGSVLLRNTITVGTGGGGGSSSTNTNSVGECNFTAGQDCYGDELSSMPNVTSSATCCETCDKTVGCEIAVWVPPTDPDSGNTCLLKRGCSQPRPCPNRVRCELSGTRGLTLPLVPQKWARIGQLAIVGPLADAAAAAQGSYTKNGAAIETVLGAAPKFVPNSTRIVSAATDIAALVDSGSTVGSKQAVLIAEAVAAANASDAVLVVLGDSPSTCGEAEDRISLDLPGVQPQLLAALVAVQKPLVLVLVHGRPVTFGPDNALLGGANAVLATWIGGEEHGNAVWSIVNGDFNPSGRLAQPWPRAAGYIGTHVDSQFGPTGLWQGDYQGMGWSDSEANGPLFPFGFGLSFGAADIFSFAAPVIEARRSAASFDVNVAVTTVGGVSAVAGGTVVQLYYSQRLAQAVRPALMLLGFAKVERASGTAEGSESHDVVLTVQTGDLGYYHPLEQRTSVDAGNYTLHVGRHSADLTGTATLIVLED